MKIPIFDGLSKHTKKQQANVEYRKAVLQQENTRKQLETQYTNSVSDLMNNQRNYEKQQSNYKLAEEVYLVTTDKYKEGIASMTELLQDELRLTEAQNGYLSAHYNYKIAELNLLKLTNNSIFSPNNPVKLIISIYKYFYNYEKGKPLHKLRSIER